MDLRRCRRDPFGKELAPEDGVDEGRFSGVELAHHNQQKELIELPDRVRQSATFVGGHIAAFQRRRDLEEEVPLFTNKILMFRGEDGVKHERSLARLCAQTPNYEFSIMNFEFRRRVSKWACDAIQNSLLRIHN